MRRAIQLLFFGSLSLIALGIIALVAVYFATGGQLLDNAQTLILQLQLNRRGEELNTPYGSNADPQRFYIASGTGAATIAADLLGSALIADADLFLDFARVEGYDRRFEAGVYFLNQTQSIARIAAILTDSSKSFIPFRSLEGARIEELATSIDQNGLFGFSGAELLAQVAAGVALPADFAAWAGVPPGASLEGFMFPDTYQLPPDITAPGLRDTLLRTFRARIGDTLRRDALEQDLTLHQAVTLASIVEREAVWRDEHALIASVYSNRLAIDMPLDADPTVQYGLQGARESWWPQITQADYRQVESPYNTYRRRGLPPGPIASPGLSAIQAAVYPETSNYYYFRAACDNSFYHNFAVTFDEHVQNGC